MIGVDDKEFGQRLKAFVVPEGSKKPSEEEVKATSRRTWPATRCRARSCFIDELPRNATGKVLKRELAEMEVDTAK